MNPFRQYFMTLFEWIGLWLKYGLTRLWRAFPIVNTWMASPGISDRQSCQEDSEEWKTNEALRTYHLGDGSKTMVTVQTSTHAFHVDLGRLSECSEYFRALSQSKMRETSESLIHLDHLSSSVFYNLLEFSFYNKFKVPQKELGTHIQVSSYLLTETFLSKCLSVLADGLRPDNCLSYLNLAQEICCAELKMTVLTYMSRNMIELSLLTKCLNDEEKDEIINLRMQGDQYLCSLRKENLTSWNDPETERARHIFILKGSEDSEDWHPVTELPFKADKWCFTTVVLYNYLYIIGGYRQRVKRGWEFKMASFRYNPFTHTWASTAPLIKHRRHFSAVACGGCIYAVGGWYLDSLVTPDSNTALYTAVECYDPWEDTWRFVSSLPLTDFQFTVSLSHDVPLATSHGHCLYVLGSIQRTGEKLLLQYNTRQDSWSELLPTLTRADADLPTLYFLGVTDRLLVIGGNNSENVVTSFCVQSRKWGQVHRAEKVAFAGQGTVAGDKVLMPSIEHNAVARIDLKTLSLTALPPLPVSMRYEAVFYLNF
ncbi:actin-binding protein IPP-like [Seriola dumerili]|uniref:Actin-binding protein IPP-like n=1 Tax=Seriola dumerili TaxID=41447 RepID=A0A3B4URB0_SERDU|nr:actin-binding protein IPP-like [Seriola dumerili]